MAGEAGHVEIGTFYIFLYVLVSRLRNMRHRIEYVGEWIPYGTAETITSEKNARCAALRGFCTYLNTKLLELPFVQSVTSSIPTGNYPSSVNGEIVSVSAFVSAGVYIRIGTYGTYASNGSLNTPSIYFGTTATEYSSSIDAQACYVRSGDWQESRRDDSDRTELRLAIAVDFYVSDKQIACEICGLRNGYPTAVMRSMDGIIKLYDIPSSITGVSTDEWAIYRRPTTIYIRGVANSVLEPGYVTPEGKLASMGGIVINSKFALIGYCDVRAIPRASDLNTSRVTIDGAIYDKVGDMESDTYAYYLPVISG